MKRRILYCIIIFLFVFSNQCFADSSADYSFDETAEIGTIFIDFLLTLFVFEFVPFILKVIKKRNYTKKEAKILSLINSIAVQLTLTGIQIMLELNYDNFKASLNFMPAFFYGVINYYWLKSIIKKKENKKIETSSFNKVQNKEEKTNENLNKTEEKERVKEENLSIDDILDVVPVEKSKVEEFTDSETSNYCTNCGKRIKEDWKFCNYCGHKID